MIISFPFLFQKVEAHNNILLTIGVIVFLLSSTWTFFTSTKYHYVTGDNEKWFWKRMDHIAIYGMIAGTYTPFLIYYLWNSSGQRLLIFVWCIFLAGVIFKMFTAGRFKILSTVLYVLMGFSILLVADPFFSLLPSDVMRYLIIGGAFYLIGAIFYLLKNWKYHHPIWHLFVIAGASAHWWSLWLMLD